MPLLKKALTLIALVLLAGPCSSQHITEANARLIGGPCEVGCEPVYHYPDLPAAVDTLPDFNDAGPKLKVIGTVYQPDGVTPAPHVILFLYHTNQEGIYPAPEDATGWQRRTGTIFGWVKTDLRGRYTFYTLRPGVYPSRSEAAHIHVSIGETGGAYYWIGSYLFDDDPLLTPAKRARAERNPRGGSSGIMKLKKRGDLLLGKRDIILRQNVPDNE